MKKFVLGLALMFLPLTANAADLGGPKGKPSAALEEEKPPIMFYRTSCYVDGGIGLGANTTDITNSDGSSLPFGPNGAIAQIGGGCDLPSFSRIVVGGFGHFNLGEMDAKLDIDGDSVLFKLNNSWAVGVRAGYMIQPTTLAFMRLGYAGASAEFKEAGGDKLEKKLNGMMVGVGIETLLFGPMALKVTADYYDWGNKSIADDTKLKGGMVTGMTSLVFRF